MTSEGDFIEPVQRDRLRSLWGARPEGVVVFDSGLHVIWANDSMSELLDYELDDWQGRQPFDAVHPDDIQRAYASFEGLTAHSGARSPNTFRLIKPDGAAILVQLWGENCLDDPDLACLALHIIPLSDQRRTEALVVEEYGVLERIALGQPASETLGELVLLAERYMQDVHCSVSLVRDGTLRVVSAPNLDKGLVDALDGSPVDARELNAGMAIERLDAATAADLTSDPRWEALRGQIEATTYQSCWTAAIISAREDLVPRSRHEAVGAHRTGLALGVLDVFRTHPGEPSADDWRVPFLVVRLAAIALERERFVATLQHQATHDPLTGLRNRRGLAEWLEDAEWDVAEDANHASPDPDGEGVDPPTATVLFCDLDRFKVMNDRYGHEFGDSLLVAVADRLRDVCGPDSMAARLGGDEFILASFEQVDDAAAIDWAEQVRREINTPLVVDGIDCVPKASIGIARGPIHPHGVDDLIRNADTAVYEAKSAGRDRCILFDDELRAEYRLRVSTEKDLSDAVSNGDLVVHFQPVVDVASGSVVGVEALARWRHARRGLLYPIEFIAVAEEAGLVTALDRWVANASMAQLKQVGDEREEVLSVWVNLSAADLAFDGLVTELLELSRARAGLRLGVELTENALVADPVAAYEVLSELRDGGLGIAIDDFGTGFSSFAALRSFPFTHVKIDRSFVRGVVEDPRDAAIVTSVVTMARAFGLTTVAEGVESAEQLAALADAGVEHVQGFLLARPAPVDELVESLGRGLDQTIVVL